MTRRVRIGLGLVAVLAAGPALAQGGMPGSTVGLTATGLPSDPFASNYPSEPPPRLDPDRRTGGAQGHRSARRDRAARRPAGPPHPPGLVPGGGSGPARSSTSRR